MTCCAFIADDASKRSAHAVVWGHNTKHAATPMTTSTCPEALNNRAAACLTQQANMHVPAVQACCCSVPTLLLCYQCQHTGAPHLEAAVCAARCNAGAIRVEQHCADATTVPLIGADDLAAGQVPHLCGSSSSSSSVRKHTVSSMV
jgi:hypothetical protein